MKTAMLGAVAVVATLLAACGTSAPPTRTTSPAPQSTSSGTSSISPVAPTTSAPPVAEIAVPKKPKKPNHCAHNTASQLVLVKLSAQRMWLCARSRTVYSNPITSGMLGQYTETPTGHYRIQGLNRDTVLTLNTGATYPVDYWIPFDAPLFGFHDSSWQEFPYGSPEYKTAGSHGCIHMPLRAIAHLYDWADIGADVAIS